MWLYISNNYFKLKLCGHKFCIECLKAQICNSLKPDSMNYIPIKCVKCNTIITNKDIFEIIIPNTPEYDFIIDKLISKYMSQITRETNKKYFWCPNRKANCNFIYSSQMKDIGESMMTCPNCSCKICLLCNDILDDGRSKDLFFLRVLLLPIKLYEPGPGLTNSLRSFLNL